VKAVARLSGRSARDRDGRFLAEGPQAVREAVSAHRTGEPGAVHAVYVAASASDRFAAIVEAAISAGIGVHEVTDEVFTAMAGAGATVTPQGLLAVCAGISTGLDAVLARRPRLIAVLSKVRDPGNAGTVIRAADAAGADAVIVTRSSVDVHNPKCVRSTAGSLFHLPVVTGLDLPGALDRLRAAGLTVLAADGEGRTDLDDLQDDAGSSLSGPVAWVFGNEAAGLDDDEKSLADDVVAVPVHGRAESLNLATAATVCLYATARAQRAAGRAAAAEKSRDAV
jgi:RNA methyltransferase, TrmH family